MTAVSIVVYRIHNISGAITYHRVRFVNGIREGWRQTQTIEELLAELDHSPWATLLSADLAAG